MDYDLNLLCPECGSSLSKPTLDNIIYCTSYADDCAAGYDIENKKFWTSYCTFLYGSQQECYEKFKRIKAFL